MSVRVEAFEEVLLGGSTNAGLVIRIGDTVRRPLRPTSGTTRALLDHLERVGFDGAPRYLGTDERGREVLSYVPGTAVLKPYPAWALTDSALISVAVLLRDYHRAATGFDFAAHDWSHPLPPRFRGEVVCHNDLNLDNIIFSGGRAVALIDFDLAGPGCVGWDLAGALRLWAPLEVDRERPTVTRRALRRLGLFADAYGATAAEREDLADAMLPCHEWCYEIVEDAVASGHETFSRYWHGGGSDCAERTSRWLATHRAEVREALGLDA
jgi:Phosphotransferase enzyme family